MVILLYDPLEDALRIVNLSLYGNVYTMPLLAIILYAVGTLMDN